VGALIVQLFWLSIFIGIYLLPWFVAVRRDHHNRMAIGVLNLLVGWTILGWIIALIWAFTMPSQRAGADVMR
jgi:hypothetical protein